jgi:hypothetical protein
MPRGPKGEKRPADVKACAIAFSRVGDPATGEFQDATIIALFGEVDLEALSA